MARVMWFCMFSVRARYGSSHLNLSGAAGGVYVIRHLCPPCYLWCMSRVQSTQHDIWGLHHRVGVSIFNNGLLPVAGMLRGSCLRYLSATERRTEDKRYKYAPHSCSP